MYRSLLLALSGFVLFTDSCSGQVIPLKDAHAHNDYEHDNPLLDALQFGFTSFEADVLIINNELYVGHDKPASSDHNLATLEELYLLPIDSIVRLNQGNLYPGFRDFCYLMIDIKMDPDSTYSLLKKELEPFKSWIYSPHRNPEGKIMIFLSGNRPIAKVMNDNEQYLSLDGRPEDLAKGYSKEQMPVISQAYYVYSQWRGDGDMDIRDKAKIRELAESVHRENKKLRFWAIPDNPNGWKVLLGLGVDIINSDDLSGLNEFLQKD